MRNQINRNVVKADGRNIYFLRWDEEGKPVLGPLSEAKYFTHDGAKRVANQVNRWVITCDHGEISIAKSGPSNFLCLLPGEVRRGATLNFSQFCR